MPRKIQRSSSPMKQVAATDLAAMGGGEVGMIMTGAGIMTQAYASIVVAQTQLMAEATKALGECFQAYCGYLVECQRTRQVEIWSATVLGEARERTRQMEIQAEAMLAVAREETRRVTIQAELTREQMQETQAAREARMEIVRAFLKQYERLHDIFNEDRRAALQNLSVDERVMLGGHRDDVLQRLRELESIIASLAGKL